MTGARWTSRSRILSGRNDLATDGRVRMKVGITSDKGGAPQGVDGGPVWTEVSCCSHNERDVSRRSGVIIECHIRSRTNGRRFEIRSLNDEVSSQKIPCFIQTIITDEVHQQHSTFTLLCTLPESCYRLRMFHEFFINL